MNYPTDISVALNQHTLRYAAGSLRQCYSMQRSCRIILTVVDCSTDYQRIEMTKALNTLQNIARMLVLSVIFQICSKMLFSCTPYLKLLSTVL